MKSSSVSEHTVDKWEELYSNKWVSLRIVKKPELGVNGYVYSHETRCKGEIVALLPFRKTDNGYEYLLKSEMTPCWGFDQVLSSITGGWEGGDIRSDAVREMKEETGYEITKDELINLGASYASKSSDTIYSLFSVDLTGKEPGEATGDGSRVESESKAVWVKDITKILDPQVSVMFTRLNLSQAHSVQEAKAEMARQLEMTILLYEKDLDGYPQNPNYVLPLEKRIRAFIRYELASLKQEEEVLVGIDMEKASSDLDKELKEKQGGRA